jgi:hypothetical protein
MERKTEAVPFAVDEKHCNQFDEVDPYNPQNTVRGWINRRQGSHYGTLWITHVNDKPCPQVIPSAPKQRYPFDNKGRWEFPDCEGVEIYEKLDGTCIIGYNYYTKEGIFTTFKTRLRPFLGEGKYGNFKLLWDEMLERYMILDAMMADTDSVFVFELYGKRNHHLIRYDTPLDTQLLFLREVAEPYVVIPPEWVWVKDLYDQDHFPSLKAMQKLKADEVSEERYITIQEEMNERVVQIEMRGSEVEGAPTAVGILNGIEGQVWYFVDKDGAAVQIKCKPERVLDYHWDPERHKQTRIPIHSIYVTIINAFENVDEPDFEFIKGLLMEEYEEEMIHRSRPAIERTLDNVMFERKLQAEVLVEYKDLGVDINADKGAVMRHMATKFEKRVCGKIFRFLNDYTEE